MFELFHHFWTFDETATFVFETNIYSLLMP
jgi:hypothetical protein